MSEDDEATVTVAQIRGYPKFANLDENFIQLQIEDATGIVERSGLPKKVRELATRLYACHLIAVELTESDGLQSFTIGPISKTKITAGTTDRFLKRYNDLLDRYGVNRRRGRAWTVD